MSACGQHPALSLIAETKEYIANDGIDGIQSCQKDILPVLYRSLVNKTIHSKEHSFLNHSKQ